MRRLSLLALSFVVTVGLVAVGCDATGPALDSGSGSLELHMTGASTSKTLASTADVGGPTTVSSIDSASVTITRAAIITHGESAQGNSSGDESEIEVLTEEDFIVDLMDLQSGLDTLMTEVDLGQGTYTQLRLITADQATVGFQDGTETEVMVASGQQTGFKVNFESFTIDSSDDRVQITIAWNVANSLQGNPQGKLVITPAIQASVDTSGSGS